MNLSSSPRADWDNFETSWDFRDLPLLRSGDWEVEPGPTRRHVERRHPCRVVDELLCLLRRRH
jgi:hypothetical protein